MSGHLVISHGFKLKTRLAWWLLLASAWIGGQSQAQVTLDPPTGEKQADAGWKDVIWQNLNPGAGGMIQSITLDPNTPGRLFLASDMEGAYRSDDGGLSWRFVGQDLSDNNVGRLSVEPGNSQRVYAGTLTGIEISDDGGLSWRLVEEVNGPIGHILIDPRDPERVLAMPGELMRWGIRPQLQSRIARYSDQRGERNVFLSRDRGETWQAVLLTDKPGRRDVLSAQWVESGPGAGVYLGTLTGVFRSTDGGETWTAIESPPGVGDHLGAALSPDGRILYGAFRVGADGQPAVSTTGARPPIARGPSRLFARSLEPASAAWHNISDGAEGFLPKSQHGQASLYWRPMVDPASSGNTHRVLIGVYRPREGLWRVDVDWTDRSGPTAEWSRALWYRPDGGASIDALSWDNGWEMWGVVGHDYHFAPASWKSEAFYVVAGQTLYRVPDASPGFEQRWEPVYTRQVGTRDGFRFYRTRGQQSVFVFDVDAINNYVVQSVADNCLLESFDSGYSWAMRTKPGPGNTSRSNSVRIIRDMDPPLVLAHTEIGWGADAHGGTLWGKRLRTFSPRDRWVRLAGGDEALAGLPDHLLDPIVPDPHQPRRVYVGTGPRGEGIYVIEDIEALMHAAETGGERPRFTRVSGGPGTPTRITSHSPGIVADPLRAGVLWVGGHDGTLWRGQRSSGNGWDWRPVLERVPQGSFFAWQRGDSVVLAAGSRDEDGDASIVYSSDEGATWKRIITLDDVEALSKPVWYRPQWRMEPGSLVALGDRLFFSYITSLPFTKKSLGFFEAELLADGTPASITDRTADLGWPYPVATRLIERTPGHNEIYMATRGYGLWRRPLPSETASSPAHEHATTPR